MDKHRVEDYLNYIGANVPSEGTGWRKMRCPFHGDTHASAALNFDIQKFKCHGCGVSGDVYDLIRHKEGGSLREAVKFATTVFGEVGTTLHKVHRPSEKLSFKPTSLGRRSGTVSLGSGRRSSSRS